MIKNSILYHRLWYVKKRNARKATVYFRILLIFILFATFVYYANKNILPCLNTICEHKAKSIITRTVNETVQEVFSENAGYGDFVRINRDGSDRINFFETDVARLNKLSARLSADIRNKLDSLERQKVSIPFGALLGNSAFSGMGPELRMAIQTARDIETAFQSEFFTAGMNQTRHILYLRVHIEASVHAPLVQRKIDVTSVIPVAETVIVGAVPERYRY